MSEAQSGSRDVSIKLAKKIRLAIVVSHPIQHFVPFYRALATHPRLHLTVVYASDYGAKPYFDKAMNTHISWNMDLFGGYEFVILPESDRIHSSAPLEINNPSISRELFRIAPDVVLINGYNQLTSLRALWWCRRNNVPAMMTSDSELLRKRERWKQLVKRILLPLVLRQFSSFLTTGDKNEGYYRHYFVPEERFFRSPFTIDEPTYKMARTNKAEIRRVFRSRLGIDEDDIVVITVGKMYPTKRFHDIIEAAQLLRKRSVTQKIRFLWAGDGILRAQLESEVKAASLPIEFLGFVNVDKLPQVYCTADIIAHPSEVDAHPLVLSESACVGLPMVVSDRVGAVGMTDIARPNENAIVFPSRNASALTEAIFRLVSDEQLRKRMGDESIRIFDELDMKSSVRGAVQAVEYCLRSKSPIRKSQSL